MSTKNLSGLACAGAVLFSIQILLGHNVFAYTTLQPSSRPISADTSAGRPRGGASVPESVQSRANSSSAPLISAPSVLPTGANAPAINISQATVKPESSPFVTPDLFTPSSGAINPASLAAPGQGGILVSPKADPDTVTSGSVTNDILNDTLTSDAIAKSKVREELIMPREEVIFLTKFGQVRVQEGALVLLIDDDHSASVYDLHDGKGKSVIVDVDGKIIALSPGKTVTLCASSIHDFPNVNRLRYVAYRDITNEEITPQIRAFKGEFQIQSLVAHHQGFKKLVNSKDARERRAAEQVFKTLSIISTSGYNFRTGPGAAQGQYSYMLPQEAGRAIK